MATAYSCDMCNLLYDETIVSQIRNLTFNSKSIEIILRVKDAQTNNEYDVCKKCLDQIVKSIAGVKA